MRKILVLILGILLTIGPGFSAGKMKNADLEGKGYVGTLPDISKSFATSEPKSAKPIIEGSKQFNSANEIKPVPRDNPAFVNIILKTDKTSQYLNDVNEVIPMLEKIYDAIENKDNVQRFVAKVYFLNKNCDYLRDKYTNKPESSYISFQKLMEVSMHAQSVSLLRSEAERYSPYLAYTGAGYIYNSNNIDQQLDYLKQEIEQAIIVLKEAN